MMELLITPSRRIPKSKLPYFESGKESNFILLKMSLESLLGRQIHLSKLYK